MTFLALMVYAGAALGFIFVTLSLACGLYYLAELVEEHTVAAKKFIKWTLWTVVALHIILLVYDRFPVIRTLFSLACHGWYSLLLRDFPTIELTSPYFVVSCVLTVTDHFMWFFFFARHYHPFSEIATFFGICVWLVPFTFFISLSANEYTLPAFDPTAARRSEDSSPRKRGNLIKSISAYILQKKDEMLPSASARKNF
ncbi:transmembrane adaptor Erv26 [Cladochytrium replicatum]|nr:transmembrane adaptor Erv26 [Cladochytrium replicatum]